MKSKIYKRCMLILIVVLLQSIILLSSLSQTTFAEDNKQITVEVNGKLIDFDNPPMIVNGRTTAPLKAVFEALGIEVQWNSADKSITGQANGVSIWLQIDNSKAKVNGKEVQLDVSAFVYEGRTYVPLKFISESTGATVKWEGETRKVSIIPKFYNLRLVDSDLDGLSDYHERNKYFSDPYNSDSDSDGILDNDWNERKEHAYTITAKMQVMKPFNSSQMNDDYQDIKVIEETEDTLIFEVVVYPFNTNHTTVGANVNWRVDDANMEELKPTVTANWDNALKEAIIADLKKDGINYDSFKTDKELVSVVAPWIWKTSKLVNGPGAPIQSLFDYNTMKLDQKFVGSSLYNEFLYEDWTEKEILEYLGLGKEMYYNKTHGACSSSSVYQTTILRALGIPTRITYQVPLFNGEKPEQRALLKNINNTSVRNALEKMFVGTGDHFYNEVFIGNEWVRLNYGVLGANIYDPTNPMAILINLGHENDFVDFNMANTWASYILYNRSVGPVGQKDYIKLIDIYDTDNR